MRVKIFIAMIKMNKLKNIKKKRMIICILFKLNKYKQFRQIQIGIQSNFNLYTQIVHQIKIKKMMILMI